jgi:glycosyltransferase involved in cell wall biosynthesis
MKSHPLVSIVIPTYNRARVLQLALKSVVAQTHQNWEALVVDSYSDDNTDSVVEAFQDSRIKLIQIRNDGVIAASRNVGIANAKGDYVAFLDSDDWWSPRKLEESLKFLERGADLVYHDLYLVTRTTQRFFWRRVRTRALKSPVIEDLIASGNALTNSSVVVRSALLGSSEGLSEDRDLIGYEDYDLWLRLAKLSDRFERIPMVLGYYWAGGGSVTNPERTIGCLAAIAKRYPAITTDRAGQRDSVWFNYANGRAHYRLDLYERAKASLDRIGWRAPLSIAVKTYWMRFWINFRHRQGT